MGSKETHLLSVISLSVLKTSCWSLH